MLLPDGRKSWTTCAFIAIQYQCVTDGRTDVRTCHDSNALCMHSHADARHKLIVSTNKSFETFEKRYDLVSVLYTYFALSSSAIFIGCDHFCMALVLSV